MLIFVVLVAVGGLSYLGARVDRLKKERDSCCNLADRMREERVAENDRNTAELEAASRELTNLRIEICLEKKASAGLEQQLADEQNKNELLTFDLETERGELKYWRETAEVLAEKSSTESKKPKRVRKK